jgi:hypothetical protein
MLAVCITALAVAAVTGAGIVTVVARRFIIARSVPQGRHARWA